MKILILALTFQFFISCSLGPDRPSYIKGEISLNSDIRYLEDMRTGLCFAEIGSGSSYSFACVPCDSVKKFIEEKK